MASISWPSSVISQWTLSIRNTSFYRQFTKSNNFLTTMTMVSRYKFYFFVFSLKNFKRAGVFGTTNRESAANRIHCTPISIYNIYFNNRYRRLFLKFIFSRYFKFSINTKKYSIIYCISISIFEALGCIWLLLPFLFVLRLEKNVIEFLNNNILIIPLI